MTALRRTSPALAALAYPALIWCGPAVSPAFLAIALIVPAVGLVAVRRTPSTLPRSRVVALLAVAAPPLYSWLGGLLDFQTALPVTGLGVWLFAWPCLALLAARERPAPTLVAARPARWAVAHGLSAAAITLFAIAHLANHLAGLWGGATHIAVMTTLRIVYRVPILEAALLAAVAFQFVSGLRLLARAVRRADDRWTTAQVASGAYLAAFLLSHLTAALRARFLRHVDTNWAWLTADSMLSDPWSARLAPYHFLAVVALGVHGALGLRYVGTSRGWSPAVADASFAVAGVAAVAVAAAIMRALLAA